MKQPTSVDTSKLRAHLSLIEKSTLREILLKYPDYESCPQFVEVVAWPKVTN